MQSATGLITDIKIIDNELFFKMLIFCYFIGGAESPLILLAKLDGLPRMTIICGGFLGSIDISLLT
jgi:hypothetical protein